MPAPVARATLSLQSFAGQLTSARILNRNLLAGMGEWNVLDVLSGRLTKAAAVFDTFRHGVFGIVAPMRELQFAIKQFAVPALIGFGAQLLATSNNPALAMLGANLQKVGSDLAGLGDARALSFFAQI